MYIVMRPGSLKLFKLQRIHTKHASVYNVLNLGNGGNDPRKGYTVGRPYFQLSANCDW